MVQQSTVKIHDGTIPVSVVSHTSNSNITKGQPVSAQLSTGNYSTINYASKTSDYLYQQKSVTKDGNGTFVCPHGRVINLNEKKSSGFKLPTIKKVSYHKSQSCLIGCMKFFQQQCHQIRKKPDTDSEIMFIHEDVAAAMKQLKYDVERFSQFEKNNCMSKVAKIDGESAKTILSRMSLRICEIEERLLKNDVPTCSEVLVRRDNMLNLIRSLQQSIGSFLEAEVEALKDRQSKLCNLLKFLLDIEKEFECITRSMRQQCCNQVENSNIPQLTSSPLTTSFDEASTKLSTGYKTVTSIDESKHISVDIKSPKVPKRVAVINDSKEISFGESGTKDSSGPKIYELSYELKNNSLDLSGTKNVPDPKRSCLIIGSIAKNATVSNATVRGSLINDSKNISIDDSIIKKETGSNRGSQINESINISIDDSITKNAKGSNRGSQINYSKHISVDESVVKSALESNRDSVINESKNISVDDPVVISVTGTNRGSLINESKNILIDESVVKSAVGSNRGSVINESQNFSLYEPATKDAATMKRVSLTDTFKCISVDEYGPNNASGSKNGSLIGESKNISSYESVVKSATRLNGGTLINESKHISLDESSTKNVAALKKNSLIDKLKYILVDESYKNNATDSKKGSLIDESKNVSIDESSTKNETALKRFSLIDALKYFSFDESSTNNATGSKKDSVKDESKDVSIDESNTKNASVLKRFGLIDALNYFSFDESNTNSATGSKKGTLIDESKNVSIDESTSKNSSAFKKFSSIDGSNNISVDESDINNATCMKRGRLYDELKNISQDESLSKNEFNSKRNFLRDLLKRQRLIDNCDKTVNFESSFCLNKEQCDCFKRSIATSSEPSSLNNDITTGYKLKSNLTGAGLVYARSRLNQLNPNRSCRTLNSGQEVIIDEGVFGRIPSQDRGDTIRQVSLHNDDGSYRGFVPPEPSQRNCEISNIWYESARQLLNSPIVPPY